jgi:hypothetical protein
MAQSLDKHMPLTRAEAHRLAWTERNARRRLLLKALGLGAAGLAAGGAAAWVKGDLDDAAAAGLTLADTRQQLDQANAAKAALALSYATLQTQSSSLQTQLSSATTQNTQLANAVNAAQQQAADLKAKLDATTAALSAANDRLSQSKQLIDLYHQLDGVGLDNLVAAGLGAVSGALSSIAGPAGLLRAGVDAAHNLLTDFENTLPGFSDSMAWLGQQVVKTKVALWAVETAAQQAANSTLSGVTAVFGGFVGFVLDHLPFNIGANVRATLNEVQSLLTGVTDMANQAPDQVMLKITHYVDDTPQGWRQALITPLRAGTLTPADQVLIAVSGANDAFKTSLHDPATGALQQRQTIRQQIEQFRAANNL